MASRPRGRPRKGTTRMDAAIDAMGRLGFKVRPVRKAVQDLLKLYGENGWPFIEDDSYKELVEALLRGSDSETDENLEKNNSTQTEVTIAKADDIAGSSNTATGQICCSEVGDFAPEAENTILKSPSSSTCNTTHNRGVTPLANEDISGWKEIREHQSNQITSTRKGRCIDICNSSVNVEAAINSPNAYPVSALLLAPSSQTPPSIQKDKSHDLCNNTSGNHAREIMNLQIASAVDPHPVTITRRRRPCYGWISDDEEDTEFVFVTEVEPAKRPRQFSKNNHGANKVKHQSK